MRRNDDLAATIVRTFSGMAPVLDERARRLWAAAESVAIGYGGDALVSAATGLRVKAKLDKRCYATGCGVTPAEMRALALHPHTFHGDWNDELRPRSS